MWKQVKILLTITESCSNPEFLQEVRKKLRALKNWVFLVGPTIWKVMPRNMWNDTVSWQTRLLNNFIKYQLHVLMIINSKKKDRNPWEKLSNVCSQIVLKRLYFARIGGPDIPWDSQQIYTCDHKMGQSLCQTSSTFDLLHSFHEWIPTTLSCGKYSPKIQNMTVSRLWQCRRSRRFEIDSRWNIVRIRKSHVYSNKPMCKKQTCVSHSSTDSEIIFLDTNLRMDGITVLDPWDLYIAVMHSNSNLKQKDKQARRNLLHDKASEKRVNFRLTKYREMFEVRISARVKEKTTTRASGKSYDMEKSYQEMCGTFLWVSQQDDSTTLQSVYSMHRWPPLQRRRNEICWRIVKSVLSNCSEMLILGTYWKTWYSMISEQTCTINRKMDQSMWQTIISFDLLHSSYMWLQTKLSCGKNCRTMQSGTTSRLRFYRRSWGFTIYVRWNIVRIRKSHICSNKLDVQETDMCVPPFNGFWNYFCGRRIEVGWYTRTWFMGSDHRSSSREHASE